MAPGIGVRFKIGNAATVSITMCGVAIASASMRQVRAEEQEEVGANLNRTPSSLGIIHCF
jgi:hypothetical protein